MEGHKPQAPVIVERAFAQTRLSEELSHKLTNTSCTVLSRQQPLSKRTRLPRLGVGNKSRV